MKVKLFMLAIGLCGNLAFANDALKADQISTLVSGKTIEGFNEDRKVTYFAYFKQDGGLGTLTESGVRGKGTWRVTDGGELCTKVGNAGEKCTKIVPTAAGTHLRIDEKNTLTNTIRSVMDGNPKNIE